VAPITVQDNDGDNVSNLDQADITYKIIDKEGEGDELYSVTDSDPEIDVDATNSIVTITISATDVTWRGNVYEYLRVNLQNSENAVVLDRKAHFHEVPIDP
jgi:tRNA threonylcarbamoyladenosine modification (KEOPS) complex  Pcc1 subunit